MFFDTHAHLTTEYYKKDEIEEILKNDFFVNIVGFDLDSSKEALEIACTHRNCLSSCGFHPYDVLKANKESIDDLKGLLKEEKVVALGEIGLDYYRDITPKDMQQKYFELQLELAKTCKLPFIIHSRMAFSDTLSILSNVGYYNGIFHSFDYGKEELKKVLDFGLYVSFSGMVTFKGRDNLREAFLFVPTDRVLFETDSPYLTPVPLRGKKNTPLNVRIIYEFFSKARKIELEELEKVVCNNVFNVFKKVNNLFEKEKICSKY